MKYRLNLTSEDLKILKERMEDASADLQHDVTEIQYLLSQFGEATSEREIQTVIDSAKSNIDSCKQLHETLNYLSGYLYYLYTAVNAMETSTAARIADSFK